MDVTVPWRKEIGAPIMRAIFGGPRYVVLTGGRSSGKSWTVASAVLLMGFKRKMRILSTREVALSLKESAHALYRETAARMPWLGWESSANAMKNPNGSEIMFRGSSVSTGTARSLLSLEGVDLVAVEEGQDLSERAWDLLRPTIRASGSRFLVTMNPTRSSDPLYRLAKSAWPDVFSAHTTYMDNQFASAETIAEAERDKRDDPEKYRHVWLGELAHVVAGEYRVLAHGDVEACRAAFAPELARGETHAGYDPADGGADHSALVVRRGPVVIAEHRWPGSVDAVESTRRVESVCAEHGVSDVWFDATGVGTGPQALWLAAPPAFHAHPVHFGSLAGKGAWLGSKRNKDLFANRAAQMAENLRRRVAATKRGEVDKGLLFAPCVSEGYVVDLSQAKYDRSSGKMRVVKAAKGERSPDRYDATALAFAADTETGVRDNEEVDPWVADIESM